MPTRRPTLPKACFTRHLMRAALAASALTPASLAASLTGGLAPDPFEDVEEILPERAPARRLPPPNSTAPGTTVPGEAPPTPGLTGPVDWVREAIGVDDSPAPLALPEGTFLARRPGRIARVGSGHLVFVPDRAAGGGSFGTGVGNGPMLLLPNQAVGRLESALGQTAETRAVLSGEVTVYNGRNYLLLTAFSRSDVPEAPVPAPAAPEAAPMSTSTTTPVSNSATSPAPNPASIADDPDIAALLEELDASGPLRGITPLPTQAAPANAPASPGAASNADAPAPRPEATSPVEGTYIVRRTGRLAQLASGALAIVFDNDHGTAGSSADAPLTLLPCRLLAGLEQAVGTRGDGQELIVSGRVFTFGQRGYLLPTLFQRPSRVGIDPVQ